MAAFDFPNSPSVNDQYTANGVTFKWNGTIWQRISASSGTQGTTGSTGPTGAQGAAAGLTISTSAPGSPSAGDMWWDSDSGLFLTYYNDGNSSQWVELNQGPKGAQGATGPTGAQGATGPTGAQGATGSQGAAGSNASISSNADNRIVTGGSGTNLVGEANLTFDGDTLLLKSSTDGRRVSFAGDGTSHYMKYDNTLGGIILNGYGGIAFETNGTNERLRIDSSGNLKVPAGAFDLRVGDDTDSNAGTQTISVGSVSSGSGGIGIFANPTNGNSFVQFGDGTSSADQYRGYMNYQHASDSLIFGTAGSERLRITSTGNLKMPDNLKIELGGAQTGAGDFYLNFDGTYATMHSGGNQMNIRSNRIQIGDNGGVLYIDCTDNSTVKLYHQSGGVATEKLATAAFGIDIPDTLRLSNGYADTGSQMCLGADSSGNCTIAGYNLQIATGNNSSRVNRFLFSHRAFYPAVDNTYDLGTSTYRWKDLFVGDAHFSNKGSSNDVDGTWGDWTLQEGENDIFMINNRTGKKFAITMREVS